MIESNYLSFCVAIAALFFPLGCAFLFISTRAVNGYVLFHVEGAGRCYFGKCKGSFFDADELKKHLKYEHHITRSSIRMFKKRHVNVMKYVMDFYYYAVLYTSTLVLIIWSFHLYAHLEVPDMGAFQTLKPDEVNQEI